MKYLSIILVIFSLSICGFAVAEGIAIKWKPIIYVTIEPGATNVLYWRESLTQGEWEMCFSLNNISGVTSQRLFRFESEMFDEHFRTGFFKHETNGVEVIIITEPVSTNSAPPPIP